MDILDLPYTDKIDMDVGDRCEFCPMLKFCENDKPGTDKSCEFNGHKDEETYSESGWHEFSFYRMSKIGNRWSEKNYEKTELEVYLSSE